MRPDGKPHSECESILRRAARELGGDVEVFTTYPGPARGYNAESFMCPHGSQFWVLPTFVQMRAWESGPS